MSGEMPEGLRDLFNRPNTVVFDTPESEPLDASLDPPHEHRWVAVGARSEGWLFWIAQSCECGETRQVRTARMTATEHWEVALVEATTDEPPR